MGVEVNVRRFLLVLSCAACKEPEGGHTEDTDRPDPEAPAPACQTPELAGDWEGEVVEAGGTYRMTATFLASAELDTPLATGAYDTNEGLVDCEISYLCTGKQQLGWTQTLERPLTGNCLDAYAFFRVEVDGSLSYEAAFDEFGDRVAAGSLLRVE